MTEAMKITLSTQPADARWGEKATYSINNDGITLHLTGKDDLGLIQRAARKIDGQGLKHVQLAGEGCVDTGIVLLTQVFTLGDTVRNVVTGDIAQQIYRAGSHHQHPGGRAGPGTAGFPRGRS